MSAVVETPRSVPVPADLDAPDKLLWGLNGADSKVALRRSNAEAAKDTHDLSGTNTVRSGGGHQAPAEAQRPGEVMKRFPLDEAERAFADLLTRSAHPIDGTAHSGLPDEPIPLPDIVEILRDRHTAQATCDSLWRFLLEHFDDEQWSTLGLGLALPALRKSVSKAARIWESDLIDLQAEAINAFLEMARRIDPTTDRLYSGICNRVKDACRTFARGLARNA